MRTWNNNEISVNWGLQIEGHVRLPGIKTILFLDPSLLPVAHWQMRRVWERDRVGVQQPRSERPS